MFFIKLWCLSALFTLPNYSYQLLTHKITRYTLQKGNLGNSTAHGNLISQNRSNKFRFMPKWNYFDEATGLNEDEETELNDCFEEPKMWCNRDTKYRTIEGSCNNLNMRSWGMSNTALQRIARANYADGIRSIRTSKSGKPLPTPTRITQAIFAKGDAPSEIETLFFMQFSQIIARDVTGITPQSEGSFNCCENSSLITKGVCLKLETFNRITRNYTCQNFLRSKTTDDLLCPERPINQLKKVTSFLDASFLYGSITSISSSIRLKIDGKLKIQDNTHQRPFPPLLRTINKDQCPRKKDGSSLCYEFGDFGENQNLGLAVTTVTLFRLHNYLCDILLWLNPQWKDDRLFQEARRILIAMYQHVIYYEYLPILIGADYAKEYGLLPTEKGYGKSYNRDINPTTINSFATAAYRSLHRLIRDSFKIFNERRECVDEIKLSESIFNVSILQEKDKYDGLLRGLITDSLQKSQSKISAELYKSFQPDLISIDIQRGRDHGIPTYNQFREICGYSKGLQFEDFRDWIGDEAADIISNMYENVDDVDLYVGLILEKSVDSALVGPVSQCIIAEQFYRSKYGDRFFYEHGHLPGSFTLDQLREIRKATLSFILCVASDNIINIQSNSFYKPSMQNPLISCELIPRPDFSYWKEPPCST